MFYPVKGTFDSGFMIEFCLLKLEDEDVSILDSFFDNYQTIEYMNNHQMMEKFKSLGQ